ncbi:MAG: 50S ribosomal protein L25/general stress protein Ctc [Frankiaceae bacterium]
MSEVRIAAEPRNEFGKGGARRTRRAGKVPAVLYGHGTPPRHISLPAREFSTALRTDAGMNVLLHLDVDGGTELALAKAIQRNPLRGSIEHVDLILVRRGEKVTIDVPVTLIGEAVRDTVVEQLLMTLSLEAEATAIPQGLEVSIDGLDVGASITAGEIALPAGATLQIEPDSLAVHVLAAQSAEAFEAELAEAQADVAGEPVEGDVVPDTDSDAGGPESSPSDTDASAGAST